MPSSLSSPSPLSLSSSLSSYHRLPPSSASHDHLIVVFFFFFVVRLFRPAVHLLLHGVIPDLARVSKVGQEARHAPIHGGGELGGGVKAPPPVVLALPSFDALSASIPLDISHRSAPSLSASLAVATKSSVAILRTPPPLVRVNDVRRIVPYFYYTLTLWVITFTPWYITTKCDDRCTMVVSVLAHTIAWCMTVPQLSA